MAPTLRRREMLLSLGAVSALAMLAACSDGGSDSQSGDSSSKPASDLPTSSGSVDMTKLLEPGPLPDKVMGEENAPVTIVEFASMTCPHCAAFHAQTLPAIKEKYIDTGKVRMIFREFPFDPRAEAAFMLARCSNDNYFPMVDTLFKQQESWARAEDAVGALLQIARLAGFSQESFEACLTDQKLLDDVRAVQKRGADEFKVDSTPTFFINGNTYKGALTIAELSAIIDGML